MWMDVLIISAVLTIAIGNLFALRQQNMKRFLAFSSIAQVAIFLLGIMGSSRWVWFGCLFSVYLYLSNLGSFRGCSSISAATGKKTLTI